MITPLCAGRVGRTACANLLLSVVDGLAIFPWEDPAAVIAEREAALDEKERKPSLGVELCANELAELGVEPNEMEVALGIVEANGIQYAMIQPVAVEVSEVGGFSFDGEYRGTPAEDRDDYVGV